MKKVSILAIGHSYVLGVNRAILREVARDPEFDVTVAGPGFFHGDLRSGHFDPEPVGSGLKAVPVPARWTRRIHLFQYSQSALRQLICKRRFDAVHAWEEPYIVAGYQIARRARQTGTPFCFRSAQSLNKRYPLPFSHFERTCLGAAQRWIAGGQSVYNNLVSRGYPAERGRVITLAVDTGLFQPVSESARAEVRRELGLTGPVIAYLGRLVAAKGLRILQQALEGLEAQLPWSLLLLGSGEMHREIEGWAARRGWQERVKILLAKHDQVPRYLAAADMMVAPSQTMSNWKEQFGRMLIEAFACAVPVIASDSGEIPHVVGDAGIVVPEKDVPAWTREIDRMLRDPGLRAEKGQAGLARVPRFSAAVVAEQYRSFYRELAFGERPVERATAVSLA